MSFEFKIEPRDLITTRDTSGPRRSAAGRCDYPGAATEFDYGGPDQTEAFFPRDW